MDKLSGSEQFTFNNTDTGITVSDYWSWAYSDLMNNTSRGAMAEFIVRSSFGITDMSYRVDWSPYDLLSPSGRRIEVKSASFLQSWSEDYYSEIVFDIAPKRAWSPESGYAPVAKRHSDIYVFCLYKATSIDQSILNLDLWDFFVLPTCVLDIKLPSQKSIGLKSLQKLNPTKADYPTLWCVIDSIGIERTQYDEAT